MARIQLASVAVIGAYCIDRLKKPERQLKDGQSTKMYTGRRKTKQQPNTNNANNT
jgi:hypothetical protein